MVDYDRATGNAGTLRIRDLGNTVEFWVHARSPGTWNHYGIPYTWVYNGQSGTGSFIYSKGTGWVKVRTFTVSTSQTVQFNMGRSGTSGLGGPTNHSAYLNRANRPNPPSAPTITNLAATSFTATIQDGANGGAAITARQIGIDLAPGAPTRIISANTSGVANFNNLTRGTTYYAWGRTQNSQGWSNWSPRASVRTPSIPAAASGSVGTIGPTTVVINTVVHANNGSPIIRREVGYGTSATSTQHIVSGTSNAFTITDLQPGTQYYFWVRAVNAVGAGPWSPRLEAETLGTVRIRHNGAWAYAIPYVRASGRWHIARPWVRHNGVWKETA